MRVILIEDVKKQGRKGDVLTVKDGYGTYLINNHKAVLETKTSKKVLETENLKKHLEEQDQIKLNSSLKKALEKLTLIFKVKTGKEGQVFGSISTKQISTELKKQGYDVDKRKIKIDVPVNTLGTTIVTVELYKDIEANLKINLTK